jgi:UDP-N-acetyl-D-mannosaminuronic acid dehydrogenase
MQTTRGSNEMIVSVIGLGYIGLPTAAILSSCGVTVVGVDINQSTVDTINKGNIHIVEPDLDDMVKNSVETGHLHATTEPIKSDVFMIAVPTPFKDKHKPDLSFIESAAKAIAPVLVSGNLVILESTSPVGATEKLVQWMREERQDLTFPEFCSDNVSEISVAHCPERVLPGRVLYELVRNDRIIGGITTQCGNKAREFYEMFVMGDCLVTDCRTAELCKLVENSYRDVNIAFANELSLICDKIGINVWELIKLSNHHPRVNILDPGPGVGGHCIAVDPWFIIDSAPDESRLIRTARLVNDSKPSFVLQKIEQAVLDIGKNKSELSIACLGLAFKADIDDLRESPALDIAINLSKMGFSRLFLVEPNIINLPSSFNASNSKLSHLPEAIESADIIVLLVDHIQFGAITLNMLSGKQVIDTRGVLVSV